MNVVIGGATTSRMPIAKSEGFCSGSRGTRIVPNLFFAIYSHLMARL